MSKQIDLLFGVKGGGSVSGTSGQHIKSQLDNITGQINKTPFKIVFEANTDAIKVAQEQINALKESIAAIPPITVNSNSSGTDSGAGAEKKTQSYKTARKELGALLVLQEKMKDNKAFNDSLPSVQALRATVNDLTVLTKSFTDADGAILQEQNLGEAGLRDLDAFVEKYKTLKPQIDIAKEATRQYNNTLKETAATAKKASTEQLSSQKLLNQAWSSYSKFTNIKDYPELNSSYLDLIERLNNTTNLTAEDSRKFTTELKNLENQAYKAGVAADTLGEAIDKKIGDRLKYLVGQFAINFVTQGLRMIYDNVVQIDSAMTELKKVTDATSQEYERFLSNASVRAKELGASLVEVINATADYARLGYSLSEASALADSAIVYQNVGDGLSGIDEATQHLISTMTAFGVAAEDSMHIVDIFNEVANNYAVSASDIGTGLQRSAAAMKAAGNSLEETVAIFTAANTIQQDADIVGTALKTMSMRLRSTKSDMESAGEDTEGMADSVSKLRKEILSLTGVDIQIDDKTYKSTYQMLQDLSEVWGKLNDVAKANVLELLFGKRQAKRCPNVQKCA